jgi:hypothetical protein
MNGQDPKLDRLYDLLPVVYRQRDVDAGQPLRALLQIIAEQVGVVEDDIGQLYENWVIETCEDWVVPYIADLIGHRVVYEAGEPGAVSSGQGAARNRILVPRNEVANTIRYRRQKGTLALLEELARDVAGWEARAWEFYQVLTATQHMNHLRAGKGGTVDVRSGDALDRLGSPFDELAHSVGVRRLNSRRARDRHNITNTGLFVWRLQAHSVTRAPAFCTDRARHHYTFSVLGNDTPLFTKPVAEPDPVHVADELNVPAPIRRRALEERTADYYGEGKSLHIWRDGTDRPVPVENLVVADLSRWAYRPHGEQVAVDPRLGRIAFSPRAEPKTGVWVTYHYGFSAPMGGGEYERTLRRPRNAVLRRPPPPPSQQQPQQQQQSAPAAKRPHVYLVSQQHAGKLYFESIGRALDAWRADAPGEAVIQVEDSGAYVEQMGIRLDWGQRLEIRAADGARPVIRLLDWYANRPDSLTVYGPVPKEEENGEPQEEQDYVAVEQGRSPKAGDGFEPPGEIEQLPLGGAGEQSQAAPASEERPRLKPSITFDGLIVVGRGVQVSGLLSRVTFRHCTLVPGWSLDTDSFPESETEPSVELADTTARLIVEHSVVGSVVVNLNEVTAEPLDIELSDSILDATHPELQALSGPDNTFAHARLRAVRTTVIGTVRTHAFTLAENTIFDGHVSVARTQVGCVRFCYVPTGSRTPRRYNCQPDLVTAGITDETQKAASERRVRPRRASERYGTPAYCQLSETCAGEITRGADDESEMGAFHDLFQPQREANLRARLDEFTPAGMDAGIIFAT